MLKHLRPVNKKKAKSRGQETCEDKNTYFADGSIATWHIWMNVIQQYHNLLLRGKINETNI